MFEKRRTALWQKEKPPDAYPATVAVTWSLAMEEMAKESPEAAELLYLLAYLAPEPVSQDLLLEGVDHLSVSHLSQSKNPFISLYQRLRVFFGGQRRATLLGNMVTDPVVWDQGMAAFRRYGLVEVTEAGLLVHRLVQAVTRDRLAEAERQVWAAAAVRVVVAAYPRDAYSPRDIGIWVRCAELLGHALAAAEHAEGLAAAPGATAALLGWIGGYLLSQGRYAEAELPYREALEMSKRLLGDEHPSVATSLHNLALLYGSQGRYAEAEPLFRDALEMRQPLLGDEHPSVATSLHNLAVLYGSQGRYAEAESLFRDALEMRQRLLGDEHPSVAQSLNNLAVLYESQGRYAKAESLYRDALEMRQRLLGDEHPYVAQSLHNLAVLYESQGRYAKAEPLFLRCLAIAEATLDPDHPRTKLYRQNYAAFLQARDAAR